MMIFRKWMNKFIWKNDRNKTHPPSTQIWDTSSGSGCGLNNLKCHSYNFIYILIRCINFMTELSAYFSCKKSRIFLCSGHLVCKIYNNIGCHYPSYQLFCFPLRPSPLKIIIQCSRKKLGTLPEIPIFIPIWWISNNYINVFQYERYTRMYCNRKSIGIMFFIFNWNKYKYIPYIILYNSF